MSSKKSGMERASEQMEQNKTAQHGLGVSWVRIAKKYYLQLEHG